MSRNQSGLLTQCHIYSKCQPENLRNFKYVFCLYHKSTMILITEHNLHLLISCNYTNIHIHNNYYNIPSLECKHRITFIFIKYI